MNTAVGNLIIVLAGAIPGYWVTVATVDTLGRKPIQVGGFIILVSSKFPVFSTKQDLTATPDNTLLHLRLRIQANPRPRPPSPLRARPILLQLRPQLNNLHRTRRMLPYTLPVDLSRFLRGLRKDRSHHCPGGYCAPACPRREAWRYWKRCESVVTACDGDLCAVYVLRDFYDVVYS